MDMTEESWVTLRSEQLKNGPTIHGAGAASVTAGGKNQADVLKLDTEDRRKGAFSKNQT